MKTIPSFTIDHIRLLRGIYVSRKDQVGGDTVTTFDIRMKEPNREPALGIQAEFVSTTCPINSSSPMVIISANIFSCVS